MAYSLRLPSDLDSEARQRCERLGISLNALLCVALDAYLRPNSRSDAAGSDEPMVTPPAPSKSAPGPISEPSKLSRQQRRAMDRFRAKTGAGG
jgi:hypothetical protein